MLFRSAMLSDYNTTWGTPSYTSIAGVPQKSLPLYVIEVSPTFLKGGSHAQRESGIFRTQIASWPTSDGQYVDKACEIVLGILEYDVTISNGRVDFATSSAHGEVVALANNTREPAQVTKNVVNVRPSLGLLDSSRSHPWKAC